ncbi:ABC-type transport auxiliary lipoprotein family protein [Caballeronia calidae]|uniref:ABC-type transport auxiliary lipoprotein family protein n=1 Tax=Caballeronia calidae TaxID=1777139 RepID=UPI0007872D70|nr:ABC-type transport auxiliary lipoprotein family protein [Caballeronia calidae]
MSYPRGCVSRWRAISRHGFPKARSCLPDLPAPEGTRALVVTMVGIGVPVEGDLTLVARNPDRVVSMRHATLRAPMTGVDGEAQAAAMSRALAGLADRIAQSLSCR